MGSMSSVRSLLLLLCLAASLIAGSAAAFVMSDGTTTQCLARGRVIAEIQAGPDQAIVKQGRTAMTVPFGQDYQIIWNPQKLSALPPTMRDFLFFHECAHAQVPTNDETIANCVGLIAMRAAGRAGGEVEAKLAAFYGANNGYWLQTLHCANASKVAPAATGTAPP